MTAIILTLTDAGLAALTNPAHTGTAALTISHIGLSQQHAGAAAAQQALTALPGEFKRLATFGGEVLSPRTIHVFLRDETADAYSLRAFGLYASTGVLLAVVSSETPIMEKVPATTLLQAVDLTFARDIDAELVFGDTNFVNPPATTTRLGVVELATGAETIAGERQDLAVTPWGLAQTLLSWAQNFAAKAHRHLISEIEGLSDALAAKANRNHTHGADDVNFGVFHVDRIPKLAIGWITGLTEQLAGLAAKQHSHAASDIDSGQLHLERLPTIPLAKVAGLIETLADKASALHSHTMAQVSGLIGALALKANLDSPDITGWARLPAVTLFKKELPNTSEGGQLRLEKPDTGTRLAGHVVMDVTGDNVRIYEDAEPFRGLTIPLASLAAGAGSYPWTSANFNPDSRVSVAATNLGASWNVPLTKLSSAAQFAALPTGFSSMVTPDSIGTPGGYGYLFKMARRDSSDGWAGLWINHTAAPGDAPELFVGSATIGSELPAWTRAWTWANFNPATKANVQYPDFYGQINLESGPARFRAIGDGDSLFLQAGTATGNNGNMILSGLFGQNLTSLRAQIGGALRDLFHTGNFNPASKADLNGWTSPDGDATVTGNKTFACPVDNTIARGNLDFGRGALEVRAKTGDGAAYLTFHRPGQFAAFFGVDTDGELKFGGWSLGEVSYRIWSERNLRQANPAEAAAGVAHDRFITPSALWSFAKSIGPNGYQQIPGTDLIIQWGVSNGSHPEGAVHAALPVAFGGGCLFACATPRNAGQAYGMDFVMQIVGRYLDRIVFYANRANSSSGNMSGYEWMAIGLARGNPDPVYSSGYPPGGGGGGGEDPFIRPEV